ncbi:uncharacterized protein VTP21DRAFT_3491 [Calcarisporiella thermophila]|uniref:uncharacterized protein n=1 Tax=Calcarisporiella thermophila TaxID=911321 RepID=UPI0037443358
MIIAKMKRDKHTQALLGHSLYNRVSNSHVLLVGAGGIGCELLKNLVLSGFRSIEVVDLDTIDLSNLNRQFLFQKQHIKKSKAQVARESALRFNPSVEIIAHHANIKDAKFNVEWFKRFDIVMNGLDNLDARRHVNQMCLAANVPLLESGTTGYLGQVTAIQMGRTECYDCQPKPIIKSYPVCTIRSTPSAPIHCIVWAKSYLFSQLFDEPEEDEDMALEKEKHENPDNAKEIENLRRESEELRNIRSSVGSDNYCRLVFEKVFNRDIHRLLSMEDMWKNRRAPIPLTFTEFDQKNTLTENGGVNNSGTTIGRDHRVWSLEENFAMFVDSIQRLSKRVIDTQSSEQITHLSFDKDDDDALDFVTATSNLRAHIFGIEKKSRFQVKEMAGNIIPAIATTNAVIAGMLVMQAFKVLDGRLGDCKTIYLRQVAPKLFVTEPLAPPNPECRVCNNHYCILRTDVSKATLRSVIKGIDQEFKTGYEVIVAERDRILYDIEFDDNLDRTLESLAITDGKMLSITRDDESEGEYAQTPIILSILQKHEDSLGDPQISLEVTGERKPQSLQSKRKREADEERDDVKEEGSSAKKARQDIGVERNGIILLDDEELVVLN